MAVIQDLEQLPDRLTLINEALDRFWAILEMSKDGELEQNFITEKDALMVTLRQYYEARVELERQCRGLLDIDIPDEMKMGLLDGIVGVLCKSIGGFEFEENENVPLFLRTHWTRKQVTSRVLKQPGWSSYRCGKCSHDRYHNPEAIKQKKTLSERLDPVFPKPPSPPLGVTLIEIPLDQGDLSDPRD